MLDWEQQPLEPGFYETVDGDEIQALRTEKNVARTRWRQTQVELTSALRSATEHGDEDLAYEVHGNHLDALQEWTASEAAYVAARLGFRTEPPPRRPR